MASSPVTNSDPYQFMWAPSPSPAITTTEGTQNRTHKAYPDFSPPLIAMVAVIGTAIIIILYTRIVSRHLRRFRLRLRCHLRRPLFSGDYESPPPLNSFDFPSSADYFGLDDFSIKSLPLSNFSPKSSLIRDCAVCLLEFERGDELRTLPLCAHLFHVDCIDVWLQSHATCPLCRSAVLVPMPAARIRPNLDDLIFDPVPEPEITPAVPSPPGDRNFLLKRSYSFGFERSPTTEASTASPWRYRHRKPWPSPFTGSSTVRMFSFQSHRGFAVKSPFAKMRGLNGVRFNGAGPSWRRSRAMSSPSAIFMRTVVTGFSSRRTRCGDPEALLSPVRQPRR